VSSRAKIPPYFLLSVSIFDCNYLQEDITCERDIENQKTIQLKTRGGVIMKKKCILIGMFLLTTIAGVLLIWGVVAWDLKHEEQLRTQINIKSPDKIIFREIIRYQGEIIGIFVYKKESGVLGVKLLNNETPPKEVPFEK
jgi:hypothetical protein